MGINRSTIEAIFVGKKMNTKQIRQLISAVLVLFSLNAPAQQWNDPNATFRYTAPNPLGDSVVVWQLEYDTVGNASIRVFNSVYLGNPVSTFHMPLSDAIMQPFGEDCQAFSFTFRGDDEGYSYFMFDMDNADDSGMVYNGQKELVIACMCKLGSGCCIPAAQPAHIGLNITCNVEEDCLKCGKPIAYYIEGGSGKKANKIHEGPTLVVKAKSVRFLNSN